VGRPDSPSLPFNTFARTVPLSILLSNDKPLKIDMDLKHSPLNRADKSTNDEDKSIDEKANAQMNRNSIYNEDNNFKSPNSIVQAQQSLLASTPIIKSELMAAETENIENLLTADEVGDFPISFTSSEPKETALPHNNNFFQFVYPQPPTNKQEHPFVSSPRKGQQVVTVSGAQPPAAMAEMKPMAAASKPKPEPTAPASGFDLLSAISRDGWSVANVARTSTSVPSFQQQRISLKYSTAPTSARPGSCSCSKTHCLKMYCACFSNSKLCSRDCHCIDCDNTLEESRIGGKLRNELLKKKQFSNAFGNRTCRCTKTHCLKMYCVCFSNGAACAEKCKCVSCENPRGRRLSLVQNTVTAPSSMGAATTAKENAQEATDLSF